MVKRRITKSRPVHSGRRRTLRGHTKKPSGRRTVCPIQALNWQYTIEPLNAANARRLRSATRKLHQRNLVQAAGELEKMDPAQRTHPDVLEIRWGICASQLRWGECLDIARLLVIKTPLRATAWINLAVSTRHARGGTARMAYDILLAAIHQFSADSGIFYHLARYSCQLGFLDEAKQWLQKAFRYDASAELKKMAREERDLEPLYNPSLKPGSP